MSDTTERPDFDADMAVTPIGPGRYTTAIWRHWWILAGPNGGLILGQLAAAIIAEINDPARHLRTLTVHFLRPPIEGPATIDVETIRTGRSVAFLQAVMVQEDKIIATAKAAASPAWDVGLAFQDLAMPEVPPPDQCADTSVLDREGPPMRTNYEYRTVHGYDDSTKPPTSWMRTARPRPLDAVAIAAIVDGMPPPIFVRTGQPMAVPTIELTVHFRATLPRTGLAPEDFVLVQASTSTLAEGFVEEDIAIWGPDGTLLAQSRQLALAR
ncbi:MAG: thioesterase family protein [Acidimicrobiales bacterium]|nr:thioesterase family protein [Acidimicrobiales bacterium]